MFWNTVSRVISHRRAALWLPLVAILGLAAPASPAALEGSPEWEAALAPMQQMPVQDYGFVRSGYTFGENHLMAIADRRTFNGVEPLEIILRLMADPELRYRAKLMKVGRPEIGKLFGAKRISILEYRDQQKQAALFSLIDRDQEMFLKPVNEIEQKAQTLEKLEEDFAIFPRADVWHSPVDVAQAGPENDREREILNNWEALKAALNADDPVAGGSAAATIAQLVTEAHEELSSGGGHQAQLEVDAFYHRFAPFRKSAVLYIFAALVYLGAWIIRRPKLSWIGYGLLALGFVAECIGIYCRWIIAGRAPLSNMFESFTFATAGMVLVALVFEAVYRTHIAGAGAAVLGFIFMVLAYKAPIFDSQIRPLMPALQSSWLTYHVVTIMLSYSAFALSFFISVAYLAIDAVSVRAAGMRGLLTRLPSLEALDGLNYRVIAVGFPFLTLGIVLGAVWAATAWGRPWGFDPKETWSAITWLIYAIYLHVRYIGGWTGRRAMILAIIGFLSVLFTYFGVNYLLPGLHSYA